THLDLLVQRADVAEVLEGDRQTEPAHLIARTQPEQDFFGLFGAELWAHAPGGEFAQEAMQTADRPGAQRHQFLTTITEQPEANGGVVGSDLANPLALECGQP